MTSLVQEIRYTPQSWCGKIAPSLMRTFRVPSFGSQFREVGRLFALNLEATKGAVLTGLTRHTVTRDFLVVAKW